MNAIKKHDAGLIVAGILLIVCAFLFLLAPGVTLVTLTAIAGAAFLVSGIFDVITYVRFREAMSLSGWALAYAVLDIVIGLMFLIHPIAFAAVIPWVIGSSSPCSAWWRSSARCASARRACRCGAGCCSRAS